MDKGGPSPRCARESSVALLKNPAGGSNCFHDPSYQGRAKQWELPGAGRAEPCQGMASPHSTTFLLDLPACSKASIGKPDSRQPASLGTRSLALNTPSVCTPWATCFLSASLSRPVNSRSVSPGTTPGRGREGKGPAIRPGKPATK